MESDSIKRYGIPLLFLVLVMLVPNTALGVGLHDQSMKLGTELGVLWVVPFVCMLLSIAVGPLAIPNIWHHHFGKISVLWGLAFLVPFANVYGSELAIYELVHAMLLEYVPFIILLFSLFTVAGGIRLKGTLVGTPKVNACILLVGTALASWMGTTGAAMLLIRPLLRANAHRKYKVHTVVFFIFLVANIGGSLTPLGDPPLFLGFLQGVDFFWTLIHMFVPMVVLAVLLLALYFVVDTILYNKEGRPASPESDSTEKIAFDGQVNFCLLVLIVCSVLMSGMWQPNISFHVYEVEVLLQNVVRDVVLLFVAALSWQLTSKQCRELNDFNWAPIEEVAKLFLGIFISMIPALAILKAGTDGALKDLVSLVSVDGQPDNTMFFWLTGGLSSFLDNAPTYLVFFNTAGGMAGVEPSAIAGHLMGPWAPTLLAVSAGSVFMGANTYIGNAPNFMVRSIAQDMGVKMPSFFGYMAWSIGILIPCFLLLTLLFF